MRSPWLAIGLLLSPGLLAAQDVAEPGAASRVEVVRVDVAVTDGHGRPVPDLTAADFEVREDGSPRTITNFAYVVVGASAPPPAAKDSGKRRPGAEAAPAPVPPRARQPRILVFVVDDLSLSRTSILRVRDLLGRFVEKSLHPDDLVGLFRTGTPATTVTLGADRSTLLAGIAGVSWNARSGRERPVDPIQKGLTAPITIGEDLDRERAYPLAAESLGALRSLIAALRRVHGRKSIVFLSEGLRVGRPLSDGLEGGRSTSASDGLRDAADGANRSSLVVYTLDPRGVRPTNLEADDFDNDPGFQQRIPQWLEERRVSYDQDHEGLERLAEATGGLFIHDTDPGKGLAKVLVDQTGYYLLGYQAPAGSEPRFHSVAVAVGRSGLRVRARSGYWGGP